MAMTLGELAVRFGCELRGDPDARVARVAALNNAGPDAVSFLANPRYRQYLSDTRAGAVILDAKSAPLCSAPVLIAKNPYATYARIATLLYAPPPSITGAHPSSVVDATAIVDPTASIGAHCSIGPRVRIGARAQIGPGCVVLADAAIGADTLLKARVTLCERVQIGERCILQPGVVIGGDGFGFAPDAGAWVKVPQVGTVRVGNDVEIGSNTTIDRGAIDDTVIEDGVKLDNQIQIGHNVRVGAHTAMAAGVGVAGSTTIGKHCLIAGKVGITGQIEICDNVILNGRTTVSGSITKPGSYSGAIGMEETRSFRRNAARFRQLDAMAKTLQQLAVRAGLSGPEQANTSQEDDET